MRGPRLVPWLLTLGLLVVTLAGAWQFMESNEREIGGELLRPWSLPYEPRATLVERIRASWEPGDRVRSALVLAGVALCVAAVWRAWRGEGLHVASLRRVALTFAILGASCLAIGLLRARTHTREPATFDYVSASDHWSEIGYSHGHGTYAPAGMVPLLLVGGVWLGLSASLGLLSLLYARRAPVAFAARVTPRRGGG